ncbi:MAG: cytochrome c oxidase subunit 3, partial [Lysobacterales bacterium]
RAGLYLFLGVITSLFLLFTISHHMRSAFPDWRSVSEPGILWFNTGILVLASITLRLARNAVKRGQHAATRLRLVLASALTLLFIAGQLLAWKQMLDAGFYAAENPANAFFYMFTAVHGLHLLGGLWFLLGAVGWSITSPEDERLPMRVELCATYWHYLLLVWFLLFYLLLSS